MWIPVNVSEGRDRSLIDRIIAPVGPMVLDVHTDPHHHRSVITVWGAPAARELATAALGHLDLTHHSGVHPRIGVVDVVPFVAYGFPPAVAVAERDAFARWITDRHHVPVFLYGPERSLPDVRRGAFRDLPPDLGPPRAHPTAGAVAVGARGPLVAYNLWLARPDLDAARGVVRRIRSPAVRALALPVGDAVQVSVNLIDPLRVGPAQVHDEVASQVEVGRAELVGLLPRVVLEAVPAHRWAELDLGPDRTLEARLEAAGITPPPGLSRPR